MKIQINDIEDLELCGVYKILNLVNNKYYIGSTKQCFRVRLNHHLQALRNNNHKNSHLQNAWNKYGENNFIFYILEICNKDLTYEREQFYLDNREKALCYNINPLATGPCVEEESVQKQIKSSKKFHKECSIWYNKYKNNEITFEDIPNKFKATIKGRNHYVWNKGKKMASTEHLKVKHSITEKVLQKCHNFSENLRNSANIIYVYDENLNFINRFRSSKDLEDLSTFLNLPLKSRFSKKRGNCDLNKLQSCNINRVADTNKTYKGLYFKTMPLHPGMDDVNEPISVKNWNVNTEITEEIKESSASYSIGVETDLSE